LLHLIADGVRAKAASTISFLESPALARPRFEGRPEAGHRHIAETHAPQQHPGGFVAALARISWYYCWYLPFLL